MSQSLPPYSLSAQDVSVDRGDVLWRHPRGLLTVNQLNYTHAVFGSDASYSVSRTVIDKPSSVIALPYDPKLDVVVLIEQVRPVKVFRESDSPCMYELCAGLVDAGETPADAMRRELHEECGLVAGRVETIAQYWVSPGWTTEQLTMYCVEVDATSCVGIYGNAEECESIKVSTLPSADLSRCLDAGQIDNGGLLIGALWLSRHQARLRTQWVLEEGTHG